MEHLALDIWNEVLHNRSMLVQPSEVGITSRHLSDIRQGRRHPSRRLAIDLEFHTGINRLAWLYPEEYLNPEAPHLYTGPWPPDLSHLEGEAREWAEKIVAAFPEGPPTKEQFRAWRKEQRRARKSNGGDG